ncbi:MAG: hypothetical protein IJH47_04150 [Oscillospiraceae bacterium]|nr:hypothetical protein [Oscillospiraceae bacterium]
MADLTYSKRFSDRREGRQIRSLPEYSRIVPYILRRRSDATCYLSDSVEVSGIERWLREKRGEGWTGLGFLHLLVSAYVRTVSMRPGVNRFVSGRRLFARNDIQVILSVKRSPSVSATETSIKVSFSPLDTVFDVYKRLSAAIDEVKADVTISEPERIARLLCRLPRPFLRLTMAVIRALDYFDWLPRTWLDASPFHGSVCVVDMGSLNVVPVDPHIPDFGTVTAAISFGARRTVRDADGTPSGVERHYVDYRVAVDERAADSYYYASALKCLKYFLKNPALLELPPEKIEDDLN